MPARGSSEAPSFSGSIGNSFAHFQNFEVHSYRLRESHQLSDEERDVEFFQGFHPADRDMLAARLLVLKPTHPLNKPYNTEDVYQAARAAFSNTLFHRPAKRRSPKDTNNLPDQWDDGQDSRRSNRNQHDCRTARNQHNMGDAQREYTKSVRWQSPDPAWTEEDREFDEVVHKQYSLTQLSATQHM